MTEQTIQVNGISLNVRDWGGQGRALVLLHGLASTSHIWDLAAPLLARQSRVVALDQRGHGQSEQPPEGYDFASVVADLDAALAALSIERPILVGHSWGGNVVLQYAAEHPERPLGVVFVDGGFLELAEQMSWEQTERQLAPPQLAGTPLEEFRRRLCEEWMRERWTPEREAITLNNFRVEQDKIYPRLERRHHMRILRALWEQRPAELYTRVRCPALLLPAVEGDDSGRRASVERALRLLPSARAHWFRDTIHDVPIHRPAELAEVITEWMWALSSKG